ncbi:MAG: YggS family pyridoxal phosphate-dependent enzyme [Waddliaceae bacterium]
MSVADRYCHLLESIQEIALKCGRDPKEIALIAVTKGHSLDDVMPAYEAGCRDFGENRLQEGLGKIAEAPQDLHWHLIGTLQKKKVSKAIGPFALIHSVDTWELAQKISQQSEKRGVVTPVLLQANTSGEEAKHGLSSEGWKLIFDDVKKLPGIVVQGWMTMAPFVDDENLIGRTFSRLRELRDELQPTGHLSMGMTHDYPIAIAEGATLLRIGTAIFGKR